VLRLGGHPGGTAPGVTAAAVEGMLSGVVVGLVFLGLLALISPHDVRPLAAAATRALTRVAGRSSEEAKR
jgi:putative peptidoglycan lipid II flippase